jgi:cytochrome b561
LEAPKRYHPLLVSLHWLVAILVALNLYVGRFVFSIRDYPDRAAAIHMVAGIAILVLVIIRFVVRVGSQRPADATSGSKLLETLAKAVHYGLYILLLVITVVGATFSLQSGRLARTFFGGGPASGPPPDLVFLLRGVHGLTANLLLVLVVLHVLAAIYHQFIVKDNLIPRMWYGKR